MNHSADDEQEPPMIALSNVDDYFDTDDNDEDDSQSREAEPVAEPALLDIPVDEYQLRQLIANIVDRDENALVQLYQQLLQRVYGLALRITRCPQTAEEVTEDTFWQVWRQAPRFDAVRGSAIAWVMTIARSRALDALRRIDRPETDESAIVSEPVSTDTPHDLLNAVQTGSLLQQALAALEPLPRQLLELAYFRGLSHDEIAQHMDMPLGSVKSLIRRTLLSLRHTLADDAMLTFTYE